MPSSRITTFQLAILWHSALDNLQKDFAEFGLENETRDLGGFYESVRMRAQGIDNSEGRQKVLSELYENFFVTALEKRSRPPRHRLHTR